MNVFKALALRLKFYVLAIDLLRGQNAKFNSNTRISRFFAWLHGERKLLYFAALHFVCTMVRVAPSVAGAPNVPLPCKQWSDLV